MFPRAAYGIIFCLFFAAPVSPAFSQALSSRLFNQSSGLTNLDPEHLIETRSGAIIVTTQGATFAFDGHGFLPLGPEQGVPSNSVIRNIISGPDNRTIIAAEINRVLIAQDVSPFSLLSLHFKAVPLPGERRYVYIPSMNAFRDGVVVSTGHDLLFLSLSNPAEPRFVAPPPEVMRANTIMPASLNVYGNGQYLWVSDQHGRICVFGPAQERCWTAHDGLPSRNWGGFQALTSQSVIARSGEVAVILDPGSANIRLENIPDTRSALDSLSRYWRIERAENEDLITQSVHGIAVRHEGVWRSVKLTDEFNTFLPMTLDKTGSLWLGMPGEGVRKYAGWGVMENLTRLSGLSNGVVWGIVRAQDGRVWIGTDSGLDLLPPGQAPRPLFEERRVDSLALGMPGILWLAVNASTLVRLDTNTGTKIDYPLPRISTVHTAQDGTAWVTTGNGLFRLDDDGHTPPKPVLSSAPGISFSNLSIDPDGTIWLTGSGMLWRKLPGDNARPFVSAWGEQKLRVVTVAHKPGGPVWVGTLNGLFRVDIGTAVPCVTKIDPGHSSDQEIGAIMIDRRGNVWVGTSEGVAILHDGQWVTVDVATGLVSNDVAQDGIYEDVDGSVWVGTAQGLSHILKPDSLWQPSFPHPSIQKVTIDDIPYHGEVLPYSRPRLDVWVGLYGGQRGGRSYFRYQIEGLDTRWQTLPSDHLVYPDLPPGHHRVLIEAVDPDTRMPSAPVAVDITIRQPWWRQPWAYALYGILVVSAGWMLIKLRTRYLIQQRVRLEATVEMQTADLLATNERLAAAHAALEAQARQLAFRATHDGLTGLLNRTAVQDVVIRALTASEVQPLSISLIDVDHFKQLNDTYGHLVGDAALVALGERLRHQLAPDETIGRYGGEEYVLLVPQGGHDGFRRISAIINGATTDPLAIDGLTIVLTVSAGVATAREGDSWNTILRRADRALYKAKQAGRARIFAESGVALKTEPLERHAERP